MSHFTDIKPKTTLKNIAALEMACKELGLELIPNGMARGYAGQSTKGDYVIKLKGPYDVALIKSEDGYAIRTDWWAGHVEKEIGKNAGRLMQEYGVAAATMEARKQGYMVKRNVMKDGSIKLTVGVR
jgi:hypothetical protein